MLVLDRASDYVDFSAWNLTDGACSDMAHGTDKKGEIVEDVDLVIRSLWIDSECEGRYIHDGIRDGVPALLFPSFSLFRKI